MTIERAQESQRLKKIKKIVRKAVLPTIVGAGTLFPTVIYVNTDDVEQRNEEVSNFLDNRPIQIAEEVAMAAGVALTLNSYFVGKKWDENRLHALRVTGPLLFTAAAGAGLIDSQTTIDFAIPAGLALASSYVAAVTTVISAREATTNQNIRNTAIASGVSIAGLGATIFLAAADKL